MNRIRAGQVLTRNPVNHSQLYRVSLSPDTVDCIVFWTKDPLNLMPYLDELDSLGYQYYFQFTVTPYGSDLETNLRPKAEIEDTFIQLSRRVGSNRVVGRNINDIGCSSGALRHSSQIIGIREGIQSAGQRRSGREKDKDDGKNRMPCRYAHGRRQRRHHDHQ